jgi:hypothetical protein
MGDEALLRLLQSMIDLHVKMDKRIDTILWRLEKTEREVSKLNGQLFANEIEKAQPKGGGE